MQVAQSGLKRKKPIFNEINITPLTDIFLVLLIIMMVVAPMVSQSRRDITPPTVAGGEALAREKVTVEVTREGSYYVDGASVGLDKLGAYLRGKTGPAKQRTLVVRADKDTKSRAVLKVFEAAQEAEFAEIEISGTALTPARAQELEQPKPPDPEHPAV